MNMLVFVSAGIESYDLKKEISTVFSMTTPKRSEYRFMWKKMSLFNGYFQTLSSYLFD